MHDCDCCEQPLDATGHCVNIDCRAAQEYATQGAARQTMKAAAGTYEPRAFTSSGRVD